MLWKVEAGGWFGYMAWVPRAAGGYPKTIIRSRVGIGAGLGDEMINL